MAVIKNFLIIISIVILSVLGEDLQSISDTSDCDDYCIEKYKVNREQTFDKTPLTKTFISACERGCRFKSIAYLLSDLGDKSVVTDALEKCSSDCISAYGANKELTHLCQDGCAMQHETRHKDMAKVEKDEEESNPLLGATPVLQVRKVMAQIIGQFQVLRTSVMTYFVTEDNTLLAVQSEPQVVVEMLPVDYSMQNAEEDGGKLKADSDELDAFSAASGRVSVFRSSPEGSVQRVPLMDRQRQYTYLLHLLMLLGAVSLTLLGLSYCLAIVRHQQRKTNKAANLRVVLQHEPLKLVRPEDLTKLSLMEEEDLQAPPLPNKQDLALTHANV